MRAQQFQEEVWDQTLTEGEVFFMYISINLIGEKKSYIYQYVDFYMIFFLWTSTMTSKNEYPTQMEAIMETGF